MNKEEILAKSRQENKEKDLYEVEIAKKSSEIAAIAGVIVCGVLYATEIIVCGSKNNSLWSIIAAMICVNNLYQGIKFKRKSRLALGIVWALITVASLVAALINIFDTSTIL